MSKTGSREGNEGPSYGRKGKERNLSERPWKINLEIFVSDCRLH